jgi:hypothetical protein
MKFLRSCLVMMEEQAGLRRIAASRPAMLYAVRLPSILSGFA